MPPHPSTKFEKESCYQNEPKLNGVIQEIIYQK